MSQIPSPEKQAIPEPNHLKDLKLAANKMSGSKRRAFQAAMALTYCEGNPRRAESVFGWSRQAVELGLHEKRTGMICLNQRSVFAGTQLWEKQNPEVASALWELAQSHAQQDPTFRTTLAYTRLTAKEALKQLAAQGFSSDVMPSPATMAAVLNRNGYRLRPVLKAKPQKKSRKPTPFSPTFRKKINAPKQKASYG